MSHSPKRTGGGRASNDARAGTIVRIGIAGGLLVVCGTTAGCVVGGADSEPWDANATSNEAPPLDAESERVSLPIETDGQAIDDVAGSVFQGSAAASIAEESILDPGARIQSLNHGLDAPNASGFSAPAVSSRQGTLPAQADLQECVEACKAGGSTILAYCGTMPIPQLEALCYAAAAAGTVSCMGFCYARFVD